MSKKEASSTISVHLIPFPRMFSGSRLFDGCASGVLAGSLALTSLSSLTTGSFALAQEAPPGQNAPAQDSAPPAQTPVAEPGPPAPAEPASGPTAQPTPPPPPVPALSGEQLAAIRNRISEANRQTAGILNELSGLDGRILEVNRTIIDVQRQSDELRAKIQSGGEDVERSERRRDALKRAWNRRARRTYKDAPGTAWAPLFSSQTWADVGRFKKLWKSLSHSHLKLVADSARIKEQLAAEKALLVAHSEDLAKRGEELDHARETLRQARISRTTALGRLRLSIGRAMVEQQAALAADAVGMRIPHPCSPGSPVQDRRLADLLDWYAPAAGPEPFLPPKMNPSGIVLTVESSWYGPTFEGCRASSGATFRSNQMTAASLTLPFGTLLKVSYAGKSAVVVISDRGPYVPGRELDLSHAASQAIGLPGVGKVSIEILLPTEPPPPFP